MKLNKDSTVLLIDDFALARSILYEPLAKVGLTNIIESANAEDGLRILNQRHDERKPVGLVICDFNMAGMSGLDLLILLRKDDKFKSLPFILLTVESGNVTIERAMAAGATDYFIKPFIFSKIGAKLVRLVQTPSSSSANGA